MVREEEGNIPSVTAVRESHEVRTGGDERGTFVRSSTNHFLRIIISWSLLSQAGAKAEGPEVEGVGVDIFVSVHWRSMDADFRTARQVEARG
jgi:hypothetical protein